MYQAAIAAKTASVLFVAEPGASRPGTATKRPRLQG